MQPEQIQCVRLQGNRLDRLAMCIEGVTVNTLQQSPFTPFQRRIIRARNIGLCKTAAEHKTLLFEHQQRHVYFFYRQAADFCQLHCRDRARHIQASAHKGL